MIKQMKSSEYRKKALERLSNKWGKIIFLGLISSGMNFLISSVLALFLGKNTFAYQIVSLVFTLFIIFAFQYGLYSAELEISRKKNFENKIIFKVFENQLYLPMVVINVLTSLITFVVSIALLFPFLLIGLITFSYELINPRAYLTSIVRAEAVGIFNFGFMIFLMVMILIILFAFGIILDGYIRFAVWAKLDFPEFSAYQSLAFSWKLLKKRIRQYLTLQLSFSGWVIVGSIPFLIGLLWVLPYISVATALFYNHALEEEGIVVQ